MNIDSFINNYYNSESLRMIPNPVVFVYLKLGASLFILVMQVSKCNFPKPRLISNSSESLESRMLLLVGNGRSEANIAKMKAILDHLMGREKVRYF